MSELFHVKVPEEYFPNLYGKGSYGFENTEGKPNCQQSEHSTE
jgi:hypothetical protein